MEAYWTLPPGLAALALLWLCAVAWLWRARALRRWRTVLDFYADTELAERRRTKAGRQTPRAHRQRESDRADGSAISLEERS